MTIAEAVAAILSGVMPALVGATGLLWWTYRRGEEAGEGKARRAADERAQAEDRARIHALEQQLAETQAQLAALQTKRRRSP
jgi:type VI protein secretion system component VasK